MQGLKMGEGEGGAAPTHACGRDGIKQEKRGTCLIISQYAICRLLLDCHQRAHS